MDVLEGELAWSLVRTRGKSKIPGWTRFSLGPNIDWPRPLHETAGQVVSRPSVIKSISPSGPSAREQVVGQYRAQHADMATATQVFPCYAPIHRLFRIPVPRPRSRSRPLLSCSLALSSLSCLSLFALVSFSIGSMHATRVSRATGGAPETRRMDVWHNSRLRPNIYHHPQQSQWVALRGPTR